MTITCWFCGRKRSVEEIDPETRVCRDVRVCRISFADYMHKKYGHIKINGS